MTWADTCEDLAWALGTSVELAHRIRVAQPAIEAATQRTGVPLSMLNGFAWVESRFSPTVISSAGARGMFQLLPTTEAAMAQLAGVSGSWTDPEYNALLAATFIDRLLRRFEGREEWAIAAYYAGPGNVGSRGPGPWMDYVRKVQGARDRFEAAAIRCTGASFPLPGMVVQSPRGGAGPIEPPGQTPRPPPSRAIASSGGGGALFVLLLLGLGGLKL